jgi:hypothetical protein
LLSQPLTLDDLLRDDLDEGPLTPDDFGTPTGAEPTDDTFRGAITDDQSDFAPPPQRPRGPRRGKHPRQRSQNRDESPPRESFGKKRSGKRVFGAPLEDRGPAAAKTGKTRFGAKHKKPRPKIATEKKQHSADNQRRGKRRDQQQGQRPGKKFGKPGGKRKGRR